MSDPFSAGSPFGAGAAPELPQLAILAQYVKDLSFENPGAPQSLQPSQAQPQVQVNVDVGGAPWAAMPMRRRCRSTHAACAARRRSSSSS
jgi:hypothetical protein